MSKRIFTKEQTIGLSKNGNIRKCSNKSITYAKDFKLKAIKQYYDEYLTPNEIFEQAGFDLNTIGRKTPARCELYPKKWTRKCPLFLYSCPLVSWSYTILPINN